ncbi:hypothetical protein SSS_09226 [Sarcoptes scabiei]|uniref:Uncharacterized protein n=1 Tax=Sarcoptes scabiei TaxID=52283 RepID=A0A834RG49_SARSC|nr:hypothetical protein SSS_09226 [Sarcoptes scabiei]
MARRKSQNQAAAETHSESDSETPMAKAQKTEMSAEEVLEAHLKDPASTLSGRSLSEYVKLNGLLHKFSDKRSISKFLPVFKFIQTQIEIGLDQLLQEDDEDADSNNNLTDIKKNLKSIENGLSSMNIEMSKISKIFAPKISFQSPMKPNTYAQAVRSTPFQTENSSKTNQLKTIIVKSISESNQIPPAIIDSKVKKIINDSNIKAKIVNIKANKSSVVIKSADDDSKNIENLINKINSHSINGNTFKAYSPKKLDPTVVIKGVSIDNDITTIVSQITKNNSEFDKIVNINDKIKFIFKMKNRNPRLMDVVLRVAPEVFQIISQQLKNNIYIDFQSCRVEYKVIVKQCQRCYQYNHRTLECKNTPICKSCSNEKSPNHHCESNHIRVCINCKNHNAYKNDTNHAPNTEHCPIYLSHIKRILDQTNFLPSA